MEIFIAWIILAFLVGAMGANKHIGFGGAFIISLLLSPIIGFICVAVSKDNQTDKVEKSILGSSGAAELEKLARLKNEGHLTEYEYEQMKKKILKR